MSIDTTTAMLTIIAIMNAVTAYFAWRGKQESAETKVIALKTELNTNSMKDALVKATGEAAHAAGVQQERVASEAKAATLAQGVEQERKGPHT